MAVRFSTGLRAAMLWDSGLREIMWHGKIEIYTGAPPESADFAPTGQLIGRITDNGDPFTFGDSTGGLKTTDAGMVHLVDSGNWVLKGIANGVPGWWRFVWNLYDSEQDSQFYPRIDGAVGDSLFQMPSNIGPTTEVQGVKFNLYLL